jgi:hypothetical protein
VARNLNFKSFQILPSSKACDLPLKLAAGISTIPQHSNLVEGFGVGRASVSILIGCSVLSKEYGIVARTDIAQ